MNEPKIEWGRADLGGLLECSPYGIFRRQSRFQNKLYFKRR